MKFNWGTGVTLVFLTFVGLSIFQLMKSRNYDNSLVKDDYYVDDIGLEELLKKKQNAMSVSGLNIEEMADDKLLIVIPGDKEIKGTINFQSPFSKKEDKIFTLQMQNDSMYVDTKGLRQGKWNLEVEWTDNIKEYVYLESIVLP